MEPHGGWDGRGACIRHRRRVRAPRGGRRPPRGCSIVYGLANRQTALLVHINCGKPNISPAPTTTGQPRLSPVCPALDLASRHQQMFLGFSPVVYRTQSETTRILPPSAPQRDSESSSALWDGTGQKANALFGLPRSICNTQPHPDTGHDDDDDMASTCCWCPYPRADQNRSPAHNPRIWSRMPSG